MVYFAQNSLGLQRIKLEDDILRFIGSVPHGS
jgi:hypothetical protein